MTPAEPFNDAYLDNIRQAIAEGRNPSSRYIVRRLLATLDVIRAAEPGLREALEQAHNAVCLCPFDGSDDGCNLLLSGAYLGSLVHAALLSTPDAPRPETIDWPACPSCGERIGAGESHLDQSSAPMAEYACRATS